MTRQGAKTFWTLACACVLAFAGLADSAAQFPPPPQSGAANPFPPPQGGGSGSANPFPPAPGEAGPARSGAPVGANPFPAPGAGGPPAGGASPCEAFLSIRQDVEKHGSAIQAGRRAQGLARGGLSAIHPLCRG